MSGDVIFVVSAENKHPVKAYQKTFRKPRPEIVHVATVLTPIDVLETNIEKRGGVFPAGKHAFAISPTVWKEGRESGEEYHILRRTNVSLEQKQSQMTESGAYFLGEKYNIFDVLSSEPHRLGVSICSSLAHKVIERAKLVDSDTLPGRRGILPGELYVGLLQCGWVQIESETYFEDHVSDLVPLSPIAVSERGREQRAIVRSVEPVLDNIQEVARGFGLTKRDLIRTECMMASKSVFAVLAADLPTLYQQQVVVEDREDAHARHWTEEDLAESSWAKRQRKNKTERKETEEAIIELLNELGDLPKMHNLGGSLQTALEQAKKNGAVSASAKESILDNWSKAEFDFALNVGCLSWDLPREEPEVEWSSVIQTRYNPSSQALETQRQLQHSFSALWGVAIRVAHVLIAGRSAVEAIFGNEELKRFQKAISADFSAVRDRYQT